MAVPPSAVPAPNRSTGRARNSTRAELDDIAIAKAKRGDAIASRALVERYAGPVFSMVRRVCPNATSDAQEDLSQDIFLKVFKALPRFEIAGKAKLSTWILTIAVRRCIDEQRRVSHSHVDISAPNTAKQGLASDSNTESGALNAERSKQIEDAMSTLSDEQRTVIVLRLFYERPYTEIADALGVDIGTIKSRLSRAKARLRTILSPELT